MLPNETTSWQQFHLSLLHPTFPLPLYIFTLIKVKASSCLLPLVSEASSAEGHRDSLTTSEKTLILFAPTLTGPLILQVYLSSEHLALLTTWPALLPYRLLSRAGLGPATVTVSNSGTTRLHRKCELLTKWLACLQQACAGCHKKCLNKPSNSQTRLCCNGLHLVTACKGKLLQSLGLTVN